MRGAPRAHRPPTGRKTRGVTRARQREQCGPRLQVRATGADGPLADQWCGAGNGGQGQDREAIQHIAYVIPEGASCPVRPGVAAS